MNFEAGATYSTRRIGDSAMRVTITVASRTAKTLRTAEGKTLRISEYRGVEQVLPTGRYSMAPIICATDKHA